MVKYADDTTVVGLISDGDDETGYRVEVVLAVGELGVGSVYGKYKDYIN